MLTHQSNLFELDPPQGQQALHGLGKDRPERFVIDRSDETSTACTRDLLDQVLCSEPVKGFANRVAANIELPRELCFRRETLAAAQLTAEDGRADPIFDLLTWPKHLAPDVPQPNSIAPRTGRDDVSQLIALHAQSASWTGVLCQTVTCIEVIRPDFRSLDENAFRFNRRRTPMAAFQARLGLQSNHPPTRYDEIASLTRQPEPTG